MSTITFEDFKKLDIVTAKIVEAGDHPNADKLYVLKIDLGGELRQIVAGIRQSYGKEELVGKNIVIVKNLQPAVIRGVESNGMLLAAKDEDTLALLIPERDVKAGSKIS